MAHIERDMKLPFGRMARTNEIADMVASAHPALLTSGSIVRSMVAVLTGITEPSNTPIICIRSGYNNAWFCSQEYQMSKFAVERRNSLPERLPLPGTGSPSNGSFRRHRTFANRRAAVCRISPLNMPMAEQERIPVSAGTGMPSTRSRWCRDTVGWLPPC